MTAFVERIVQRISEAAPFESAVSTIVAGVLESTAAKLSRGAPVQLADVLPDQEAA
jgi:hypothetical protein